MANANSTRLFRAGAFWGVGLLCGLSAWLSGWACAADADAPASWCRKAYQEARAAFHDAPTNAVAAWHLARACFDCSFAAQEKAPRMAYAREGVEAAQAALRQDPRSAPGWYYLALNEGQLASARSVGALSLVKKMERHLLKARELNPAFDYGGPDRTLGLLYRDAPGWPISVGSRKKARRHLERALALAPEYFENHLSLIEALVRWHKWKEAAAAYAAAQKILPAARRRFTGERWAASWADWDRRWAEVGAALRRRQEREKRP